MPPEVLDGAPSSSERLVVVRGGRVVAGAVSVGASVVGVTAEVVGVAAVVGTVLAGHFLLRGTLIREEGWSAAGAAGLRASYLARHAIAERQLASGRHRLYALIVTWAKLTDNRLGFGAHPIVDFDGWCSEVEQSPA